MNQHFNPPAAVIEGKEAIARFLTLVTGRDDPAVEWRLIRKRDKQSEVLNLWGTYAEHTTTLHMANDTGFDIYIVLNEAHADFMPTEGNGAKDADIVRTRAWFIDRDANCADAATFSEINPHLAPHFATGRSEENFHLYWRAEPGINASSFKRVQRMLAAHYATDPSISNPSRVTRVPGFYNRKDGQRIDVKLYDYTAGAPADELGNGFSHCFMTETIVDGLPEPDAESDDSEPEEGVVGADTLDRLLDCISADLSREDWRKVLGAVKTVTIMDRDVDKLALLDAWSAPGKAYRGFEDVEKEFNDWKPTKKGGSGFGALVHLARAGGYVGSVAWQPPPPPEAESLMSRFEGTYPRQPTTHDDGLKYLRSFRVSRLDELPDPEWLVHRIIPRNAVGYFYGGSGSMKSFTIQDLMMTAALPLDGGESNYWMGNESNEGFEIMGRLRSAFVILEGERGLKKRVGGWMKHHSVDAEDLDGFFTLIPDPPDISTSEGREALARTIRRDLNGHNPDIIALDTAMVLAAANRLSLMKVDEAQLFAGLVREVKATFPGSAVVLVHHTGKEAEKGIIGGSNQYAGADFVFEFVRPNRKQKPPMVEVHNRKDRDEEDETHFNIQGHIIDLGRDRKGKPLSTLAVVRIADVQTVTGGHTPSLTTIDAAIQVIEDANMRDERVHGPKALADAVVALVSPGLRSGTEDHAKAVKNAQTMITRDSREWSGRGKAKAPGRLYAYKAGDTYVIPRHLEAQARANARGRMEDRAFRQTLEELPADEGV